MIPQRSLGIVCLSVLLAAAAPCRAGCSRPFEVPVAPIGMSVTVSGQSVGGLYPEVLRAVADQTGCEFRFSVVPRARLAALFETGKADLLAPATSTPRRDQFGFFVPLIASRAALISVDAARAPVRTGKELLERRELRIALVRGFDYGDGYQALVKTLTEQGRVFLEVDPVAVARLLNAGYADLTIMSPMLFAGSVKGDARVAAMLPKLRIETIDELAWGESGIYISKASVSPQDRATIERAVGAAVKSGAVWDGFKRYYSPEVLAGSARPF